MIISYYLVGTLIKIYKVKQNKKNNPVKINYKN